MILHLFVNEKFTIDYIKKINQLFTPEEHFFLVYPKKAYCKTEDLECSNVKFCDLAKDHAIIEEKYKLADKVILHKLPYSLNELRLLCYLYKKYRKKMVWVLWGADLYNAYQYNHSLAVLKIKPLINEYYRKKLISNIYMVLTATDYEELVSRYSTNAIHSSAQYTYKLCGEPLSTKKNELVNIMVGHSATDTCRHLDVFEKLKRYQGKIKVFCPLSYPKDEQYISRITKAGESCFGKNFVAMTDFMGYDEYIKFLNSMDIGIFDNNRQQGMGNITNMLYLGKKVYLSEDNTINKIYARPEYEIFTMEEVDSDNFLMPLPEEIMLRNRKSIEDKFSDNTFEKEWKNVFEG